jgi:hypothetical protein
MGGCQCGRIEKKIAIILQYIFLVLLNANPQRGIFPEMSEPQAFIGALVSVP